MTVEEYRAALNRLSPDQFRDFRERWGGAAETVDACVQAFAYSPDPVQWERIIIFRLRELGIQNLKTEHEKILDTAQESAEAAKASANASQRSADLAAGSVRWAQWSVVVAVLAVLVSVITRACGVGGSA